ncbi:MAG: FeoC-like transcriptional regulator [Magnetococcus sp. YQC-3]
MVEEVEAFLKDRQQTLLVDLAIHLLMDPEDTRALLKPLIDAGRVQRIWQPRKTEGVKCCGCDNEEYLRWVGEG